MNFLSHRWSFESQRQNQYFEVHISRMSWKATAIPFVPSLLLAGSAKLIEFNPLRGFDVTLPHDAVFVIAHSLADHNKAATNDFNTRVLECRLAAQVIITRFILRYIAHNSEHLYKMRLHCTQWF